MLKSLAKREYTWINVNENRVLAVIILLAAVIALASLWMLYGKTHFTGLITNPTGTVTAVVPAAVDIFLQQNIVNFGTVGIGSTFDTTGNYSNASRFLIRNDGSVLANITAGATQLWNSSCTHTGNYEYNASNTSGNTSILSVCGGVSPYTPGTWTDMRITAQPGCSVETSKGVACNFNFSEGNDYARVEIRITVPSGESAGGKSSTVTFTASQA